MACWGHACDGPARVLVAREDLVNSRGQGQGQGGLGRKSPFPSCLIEGIDGLYGCRSVWKASIGAGGLALFIKGVSRLLCIIQQLEQYLR